MPTNKMEKTTLILDATTKKRLGGMSKEVGLGKETLIRRALILYLDRYDQTKNF